MSKSGLGLLSRAFSLLCLASCLLAGRPLAFADTSGAPGAGRMYTPAPIVQVAVPELRQRLLSDAQKVTAEARLRLQVSGDAPADPTRVVVVRQTPEPNAMVPVGTTITVVVQVPAARPTGPSRAVIVPERLTVVPDLLKHSLSEAQPLVTTARLRLEVSGGAPEDTSHAIVVEQKPPSGTRVPVGTAVVVAVQIQRAAEWTIVPDVRNHRLAEAPPLLSNARLKLEVSGGWPQDASRASIVDQKPPPGTRARSGSTVVVTVQIPQAEELAVVPELRPQLLRDAQRRVTAAQLRLEVAGGWPADPSRAVVVEQKPAKGTRVPLNSIVAVAVRPLPALPVDPPPAPAPPPTTPPHMAPSTPPPPPVDEWVLVPGLQQRPLMQALPLVRSTRLRLEVAGGWPSDPAHAVVAGQTPAEGTRVRIGSTVTVQIAPVGQALQSPPPPPPAQPPPDQPPPSQPPSSQPKPTQAPSPPPTAARPPPARVELVVVPDLQQQPLPEARRLTTSARLELRARGQSAEDETRAIVVSQRPAAGARVAARSVVLVELGPALLAVPDLRQHPLDEARQMVSQAGFALAVMGDPPSNPSRAQVVEQMPMPGERAAAGSTITVRAKVSRLTTWLIAGAGALLAAGAAALGVARWRGVEGHAAPGLPGVRVVANSDVGTQELRSNGAAAEGFALRLRSRIDAGSQTVDANARIVAEEWKADG